MNKQELIALVAEENNMSKSEAGRVADSIFKNIMKALARGDYVRLVGFGSFKTVSRAARVSHNPKSGKKVNVPATIVPKFIPSQAFKDVTAK